MGEDESFPDIEGLSPEEIGDVWGDYLERRDAEEFAKAKSDGLASGKEPFDIHRFFDFYVMRSKPDGTGLAKAAASWEFAYFCSNGARHMTVKAFAEALNDADVYDGG